VDDDETDDFIAEEAELNQVKLKQQRTEPSMEPENINSIIMTEIIENVIVNNTENTENAPPPDGPEESPQTPGSDQINLGNITE